MLVDATVATANQITALHGLATAVLLVVYCCCLTTLFTVPEIAQKIFCPGPTGRIY